MAIRRKRRRKSSIMRLPPAVRENLEAWLNRPSMTQKKATELTNAMLEEMGLAQRVTHSSVCRHDLRMRAAASGRYRPWPALNEWIRTGHSGLSELSIPQFIEMLRGIARDLNAVADLAESSVKGFSSDAGRRGRSNDSYRKGE